jgi:hypothetical protein
LSTAPSDIDPSPAGADTDQSACRLNSGVALRMLGVVLLPCFVLGAMANDPRVLDAIHRAAWAEAAWKKQIPIYCYYDHFVDSDDRMLHQDLPTADFSRGGVCLIGASSLNWGLKLWDLPGSTRPLIHNFAMRGTNHADQFELIRYLVEQEGLLRAGGEKTLVVFGLSYHMTHNARIPGSGPRAYFGSLWTRRGFYTIDPVGTIHRSGLHPLLRRIVAERAKITGLLRELVNLAYTPLKPVRVLDPDRSRRDWAETLGPRWEEKIRTDVAAFARTVKYLREHGARVLVIAMPEASWNDAAPFDRVYMQELRDVCDREGARLLDLRKTIPDDDFADSVHLNPAGIETFHRSVIGLFLDHLRSVGALAPSEP